MVPDFFNGDPFDPENVDRPLPIWMKDHEPVSYFLKIIFTFIGGLELLIVKKILTCLEIVICNA